MRTINSARPITIDRSYKVDAVESAKQLPNGDIVLSAIGRLAAEEPEKTYSLTLLISAKEIQAAKETNKEQRKTNPNASYPDIPAIRCEIKAAEGGMPFLVMQNLGTADAGKIMWRKYAAAVRVVGMFPYGNAGFRDRALIIYIEQYDDGSTFQGIIKPDAKDIQISKRKKLWLLPLAVVGDVVTLPFQVVGVGLLAVIMAGDSVGAGR